MVTQVAFPFDRKLLVEITDVKVAALYRECTPRILVVTDSLNFDPNQGFGLTQFVNTLKASQIHGMTPTVTTASRLGSAGADLVNYDFNHATQGLLTGKWDVLFLFGVDSEGANVLPPAQVATIETFMHRGGGVFATGDHETLGASLCGNIGRVRQMRRWKAADNPPHVSNTNRHSTNLSGDDETEQFEDQSNNQPQRLYVNYRTVAGGTVGIDRLAHPVLQMKAPRRVLEVFPDHPHEGECQIPAALAGTMTANGNPVPQWPNDAAGAAVWPEVAAFSVSHGDGFPNGPTGPKQGLVPKLFGAISAYDGHRATVGRVVADATWHHFININLDGKGSPFIGLQTVPGTDSDALTRIRQYYVNLATWLMPKKTRRCLRFPLVLKELVRFPLFEELDLPRPPEPDPRVLREIGATLMQAMRSQLPAWEAAAMADEALEDALGAEALARLHASPRLAGMSIDELRHAALGGVVQGLVQELATLKSLDSIKPHESFEAAAGRGAREAVGALLGDKRKEQSELAALIDALETRCR